MPLILKYLSKNLTEHVLVDYIIDEPFITRDTLLTIMYLYMIVVMVINNFSSDSMFNIDGSVQWF